MACASLAAPAPPAITTQPPNKMVAQGQDTSLTVAASGTMPLRYQWWGNGTPKPDATNATLVLSGAQASVSGDYWAVVRNPYGSVTSRTARVLVVVPPEIIEQPLPKIAAQGEPVALRVMATGTAPAFQWNFNGQPIAGATNATFVLPAVNWTNAGDYFVAVSNMAGAATSIVARLDVVAILAQPQSVLTSPGANIVLHVGAAGPDLQYRWSRNGVPLPGAVEPILIISNATPRDGGTYRALVFNPRVSLPSAPAVVQVASPVLPFTDNFSERGVATAPGGMGSARNVGATREAGEPSHDGAPGGHSMWLTWIAPANGIASFDTLGSDFDTVLAVYTGQEIGGLTRVASDDDTGGFRNGKVLFNAQAGIPYQIAVDGYDRHHAGNVVLAWSFQPTTCPLPANILRPQNITVMPDRLASLTVNYTVAPDSCPLNLRWFRDGIQVNALNTATLEMANLTKDAVGAYSLRIGTENWEIEVPPAEVQINTEGVTTAAARSKLADAMRSPLIGTFVPWPESSEATITQGGLTAASLPAASGYSGSQVFQTYPGKDPTEPDICGVAGGASYWFTYVPPETGTLFLNTDGSSFDTLLGIFKDDGRNLGYESLIQLACDNDSGTNGLTSALSVAVTGGTSYFIMIDGVSGAHGQVSLNYRLDARPIISAISAQTVLQDHTTSPIAFTIRDRETAPSNLIVTGSCTNTNLLPAAAFAFAGTGTNRTVQITPKPASFGTNAVVVQVKDAVGNLRSVNFTLNVVRAPLPLGIATATLPVALAGAGYSAQLVATGGVAAYSWSLTAGTIPGLSVNSDGSITGIPTLSGTNQITIRVTDAESRGTNRSLTLVSLGSLTAQPMANQPGQWQVVGRPGYFYVLEATTNLETLVWTPVSTNSSPNGIVLLIDPDPTSSMRFYRVREL